MHAASENGALRKALQRVAEECVLSKHALEIAALASRHPHSIKLVEESHSDPNGFNCFMHALGISELPSAFVQVAMYHNLFPDSGFVAHLIATQLVENDAPMPSNGDIVVYFEPPSPKHAGLFCNGLIESKWGIGHLWQHGVLEIPWSYGQAFRFFRPIGRQAVLDDFAKYAEKLLGRATIRTDSKRLPTRVRSRGRGKSCP